MLTVEKGAEKAFIIHLHWHKHTQTKTVIIPSINIHHFPYLPMHHTDPLTLVSSFLLIKLLMSYCTYAYDNIIRVKAIIIVQRQS